MLIHISPAIARGAIIVAVVGLVGALAPIPATAQTPQVITLEQAIDIALRYNPSVRQAENSARLSTLNVQQQERQLLPDLSLTTGTGVPYGMPGATPDPALTAGVGLSMQIGNVYSTVANLRQARFNEEGSEHNLVRSRQTVVLTVLQNYLSLHEAQEQLAVQERNLAAVEAQERQIEEFVTAGRRSIADLYQQQASTASARLSVVQAQRTLVVGRMNLIRTLQLDPFGEYQFVVPDFGLLSADLGPRDLQAFAAQAYAERSDLRASEMSLSSAEQGLRVAASNRWPSLSVQLGYNTGNFNSTATGSFFDQLDQGRRGNLSLNVRVPLVDFTYGINRERAQITLENARINLENTRQTIANEVRTAYLDLELAEEQLTVAEAQMQAADRALETATVRYENDVATLLEVTQAQVAHLRASTTMVNARYELVYRSRLLEYYLGTLEP